MGDRVIWVEVRHRWSKNERRSHGRIPIDRSDHVMSVFVYCLSSKLTRAMRAQQQHHQQGGRVWVRCRINFGIKFVRNDKASIVHSTINWPSFWWASRERNRNCGMLLAEREKEKNQNTEQHVDRQLKIMCNHWNKRLVTSEIIFNESVECGMVFRLPWIFICFHDISFGANLVLEMPCKMNDRPTQAIIERLWIISITCGAQRQSWTIRQLFRHVLISDFTRTLPSRTIFHCALTPKQVQSTCDPIRKSTKIWWSEK